MASNDNLTELDGSPSGASPPGPGVGEGPRAILLLPDARPPPRGWQEPWLEEGCPVVHCNAVDDLRGMATTPLASALVALECPAVGDAGTVEAMTAGLHALVHALDTKVAQVAAPIREDGGFLRRADFLAHLSSVIDAAASDCWVLLAIRVDQLAQLDSRLDMTAVFDLEERICKRFADALMPGDFFTIWLELGFGLLVRRENGEQVERLAERICATIADEPFVVEGEPTRLTVSIGVALPPQPGTPDGAGRWFAGAHAAQAIAVRHGGNRHDGVLTREFEPVPAERVLIIREWVEEAKQGGNLLLDFEPVFPLSPGAEPLYSVCAKLRDYRAPLGGVYRHEYLPHARKAGAMVMIDRLSLFGAFEALEQERARGRNTRLLVPAEPETLDGVPWRWLEAEVNRHRDLADGLIVEFDGDRLLDDAGAAKRIGRLRALGVRVGVADASGGLGRVPRWLELPLDVMRLPFEAVDALSADAFWRHCSLWLGRGRQTIVDSVPDAKSTIRFAEMRIDYLCGRGIAEIGSRLDYAFQ